MTLPSFERKVVGVGLGRTGTNSLSDALNHLGVPTIHTPGPLMPDELRSGKKHLDLLRAYQGIANGTGAPYRRIDREYPGSRFILTVRRDTDAWLESKRRYAELELQNWSTYDDMRRASKRLIREEVYGSFEFDAAVWLEAYETHTRAVMDYFDGRPESLLVMDVSAGDGWDVLCPFLGIPEPAIDFPHANALGSAAEWHGRVSRLWTELDGVVEGDRTLLLVDDGELGPQRRRCLPFLERDGEYWGRPADDQTAIAELERMRGEGAAFAVFIWSTFWWLEHYAQFHRHLSSRYERVLQNELATVFDLRAEREE
jgi:hypothetical protein